MIHIEALLQEYQRIRRVEINRDLFLYILKLYPSLLVCMSDGKLDDEEWDSVMKLAKGLAEEYAELIPGTDREKIAQNFRTEFRYLLENVERWQKKFLSVLKGYIEDSRDDKEFIMESMYLFANAADGISMEEQQAINNLSDRLELEF
ncbi:MAG: hypothetical protein GY816_22345 [Cytophagales bacterium]|nr:hypothetical protein [Cytophagales bacterium]